MKFEKNRTRIWRIEQINADKKSAKISKIRIICVLFNKKGNHQ